MTFRTLFSCILLLLSLPAFAVKPTSITFREVAANGPGKTHFIYDVECSNGKVYKITAWEEHTLWCRGMAVSVDKCSSGQIQVAKIACQSM